MGLIFAFRETRRRLRAPPLHGVVPSDFASVLPWGFLAIAATVQIWTAWGYFSILADTLAVWTAGAIKRA
jgi:hypothetical protein